MDGGETGLKTGVVRLYVGGNKGDGFAEKPETQTQRNERTPRNMTLGDLEKQGNKG